MFAIECILKLWKALDSYFLMYINANAALYSEMYSFGMTLVIWSFDLYVYTNCLAYCLNY